MPDIPSDFQLALAERYELRRVLGRGGMATVYLAWDRKHQREVALKVLLPALAAFLGAERFLREIEISARLTHPHILPLYDSGEAGGQLFYVMPFVGGGSLRDRIAAGTLKLDDAVAVLRPVADALSYAHRLGLVHRDIKPENILFSQGHPVVADFGIARAVTSAGRAPLTRTGFPVGTPGYMSPEQAAGLTELDARSDVYSLAVVMFEMLVGELPGRWPTEEAVRTGRFLEASAGARTALQRSGPRVESALVRALAVRLDQRTPTPAQLVEELTGRAVPRPRYSAEQVEQIVHRAAELEASNPTEAGSMTMGGVEALAAEVGIDPKLVQRAAASMSRTERPPLPAPVMKRNAWANGVTHIEFERVVEGELPEEEYTTLVDEIRHVLRMGGNVNQLGRSFVWSPAPGQAGDRKLEVVVTIRGGRTRINVHESLTPLAGAIFGGIGGGMGGGGMGLVVGVTVGALNAPLALIGAIPLWLGSTYLVARTAYRATSEKRVEELRRLVDRLEAVVRETVGN